MATTSTTTGSTTSPINTTPMEDAQKQALDTMIKITTLTTKFTAEMDVAKAAHSAAQSPTINS